ncbi:hypothetical protein [Alicyclobacillus sp. SO9]|uniref:hypothetical protein n=1 Tax=Alicyclobacillus sp. SO9 TaxID=2665646 RepID=UPI0018E80413|nr:hypothetical protein [Alicyclobacillus sp. SO9]QQE81600.1 hypothetical protein GI364_24720 [Alicyclobacillus sp. SO9]
MAVAMADMPDNLSKKDEMEWIMARIKVAEKRIERLEEPQKNKKPQFEFADTDGIHSTESEFDLAEQIEKNSLPPNAIDLRSVSDAYERERPNWTSMGREIQPTLSKQKISTSEASRFSPGGFYIQLKGVASDVWIAEGINE